MHYEMLVRNSNKRRRLSQVPRSEAGELSHLSCETILVEDPVVVASRGTIGVNFTDLNDSIPAAHTALGIVDIVDNTRFVDLLVRPRIQFPVAPIKYGSTKRSKFKF